MLCFFIQESHSERDVEKLWQKQWNGKIFYSHRTTSSRGVFIALKKNLEFKFLSPESCDPQGRHIILNIEIMGSPFTLINYHAPNNQSNELKILKEIQVKLKIFKLLMELVKFGGGGVIGTVFLTNHWSQWMVI